MATSPDCVNDAELRKILDSTLKMKNKKCRPKAGNNVQQTPTKPNANTSISSQISTPNLLETSISLDTSIEKIFTRIRTDNLSKIAGIDDTVDYLKRFFTGQCNPNHRRCIVQAPNGCGKTLAINTLVLELCVNFYSLCHIELLSVKQPRTIFERILQCVKRDSPCVIIVEDIDRLCPEKKTYTKDETLLANCFKLLFNEIDYIDNVRLVATCRSFQMVNSYLSCFFDKEVEIQIPNSDQRVEILNALLLPYETVDIDAAFIEQLARDAHSFSGRDMLKAIESANEKNNIIIRVDLHRAFKSTKPTTMKEITLEIPKVFWSDIGGMREVREQLEQAVVWPIKYRSHFERHSMATKKAVLLYGPPGCSKTLIGKALATENNYNFVPVNGPELFTKYVGDSEANVRKVFEKAKQAAPAIIFIDEIDGLASNRDKGSEVGDRVLTTLLTQMDGLSKLDDVVVIGTTNRPDLIDRALLRPGRFDSLVYVPLPDTDTRREIFTVKMKKMIVNDEVWTNFDELVDRTWGYSGAEIVAVCQEAVTAAIQCDCVDLNHFRKALDLVWPRTLYENVKFCEDFYDTRGIGNAKLSNMYAATRDKIEKLRLSGYQTDEIGGESARPRGRFAKWFSCKLRQKREIPK